MNWFSLEMVQPHFQSGCIGWISDMTFKGGRAWGLAEWPQRRENTDTNEQWLSLPQSLHTKLKSIKDKFGVNKLIQYCILAIF